MVDSEEKFCINDVANADIYVFARFHSSERKMVQKSITLWTSVKTIISRHTYLILAV